MTVSTIAENTGKSKAGRPVNAKPEQQREKIIRAALAEFSQKGFSGASVRTIALQAGVAHGLIRHYYQSKEELFRSAADFLFEQIAESLSKADDVADCKDPVQQLEFQIRAFVHMSASLPHMAAFLMQAGLDGGEHFAYVIEKHVKPLHELSLAPYRQAVADGLMHDMDPGFVFLIATHAATAPFANMALRHALSDAQVNNATQIEEYANTLIRILLEGSLTEKHRLSRSLTVR